MRLSESQNKLEHAIFVFRFSLFLHSRESIDMSHHHHQQTLITCAQARPGEKAVMRLDRLQRDSPT